ncbi:MAG: hypothetical protein VKQ33_01540 [Candidatus Sericytochromatia bacterium]|nr:hypothetical protein [Candidatus Sericytochromatia bacterium]
MRARQTERFEATLIALAGHVESTGFEGRGGFHAWERLKGLLRGLHVALDYYELEGDVAPARREYEAYRRDLASVGLQPDRWAEIEIGRLLQELEGPASRWEVTVGEAPPADPRALPGHILAVRPEALEALAERRHQPAGG